MKNSGLGIPATPGRSDTPRFRFDGPGRASQSKGDTKLLATATPPFAQGCYVEPGHRTRRETGPGDRGHAHVLHAFYISNSSRRTTDHASPRGRSIIPTKRPIDCRWSPIAPFSSCQMRLTKRLLLYPIPFYPTLFSTSQPSRVQTTFYSP